MKETRFLQLELTRRTIWYIWNPFPLLEKMELNISFTSEATKHLRTSESTLTVSKDIFAETGNVVPGTKNTKFQYLQSDEKETFSSCQELYPTPLTSDIGFSVRYSVSLPLKVKLKLQTFITLVRYSNICYCQHASFKYRVGTELYTGRVY